MESLSKALGEALAPAKRERAAKTRALSTLSQPSDVILDDDDDDDDESFLGAPDEDDDELDPMAKRRKVIAAAGLASVETLDALPPETLLVIASQLDPASVRALCGASSYFRATVCNNVDFLASLFARIFPKEARNLNLGHPKVMFHGQKKTLQEVLHDGVTNQVRLYKQLLRKHYQVYEDECWGALTNVPSVFAREEIVFEKPNVAGFHGLPAGQVRFASHDPTTTTYFVRNGLTLYGEDAPIYRLIANSVVRCMGDARHYPKPTVLSYAVAKGESWRGYMWPLPRRMHENFALSGEMMGCSSSPAQRALFSPARVGFGADNVQRYTYREWATNDVDVYQLNTDGAHVISTARAMNILRQNPRYNITRLAAAVRALAKVEKALEESKGTYLLAIYGEQGTFAALRDRGVTLAFMQHNNTLLSLREPGIPVANYALYPETKIRMVGEWIYAYDLLAALRARRALVHDVFGDSAAWMFLVDGPQLLDTMIKAGRSSADIVRNMNLWSVLMSSQAILETTDALVRGNLKFVIRADMDNDGELAIHTLDERPLPFTIAAPPPNRVDSPYSIYKGFEWPFTSPVAPEDLHAFRHF